MDLNNEKMNLINQLTLEKEQLENRLRLIKSLLATYGSNGFNAATPMYVDPNSGVKATRVDPNFPINERLIVQSVYIIQRENRFLHKREIVRYICEITREDEKKINDRISQELSKAKHEGLGIANYKVDKSNKNTFWGSKEWLDENNEPLDQYRHLESMETGRKSSNINLFSK